MGAFGADLIERWSPSDKVPPINIKITRLPQRNIKGSGSQKSSSLQSESRPLEETPKAK